MLDDSEPFVDVEVFDEPVPFCKSEDYSTDTMLENFPMPEPDDAEEQKEEKIVPTNIEKKTEEVNVEITENIEMDVTKDESEKMDVTKNIDEKMDEDSAEDIVNEKRVTRSTVLREASPAVPEPQIEVVAENGTSTMIKKNYKCPKCKIRSYTRSCHLNRHLRYECGQDIKFKCPYCVFCSKQVTSIRGHVRAKHPGKSTRFSVPLNHRLTLKTRNQEAPDVPLSEESPVTGEESYQCKICPRTFKTKEELERHLHVGKCLGKTYECLYCPYRADMKSVTEHMTWKHPGQIVNNDDLKNSAHMKRVKCNQCQAKFLSQIYLISHLQNECSRTSLYECPYCEYRSEHTTQARNHVERRHPGKRIYIVDHQTSSEKFRARSVPYLSRDVDPARMKYVCAICSAGFAERSHMVAHTKYICGNVEKNFKCPYCSYRITRGSEVYKHIRRVHKNKKVYYVKCDGEA